jgi:multiple sugar transport system substrate-binding protein
MRYSPLASIRRGVSTKAVVAATALSALAIAAPIAKSAASVKGKAASVAPATLTFWTWVSGIQTEVNLFEQAYPQIKVNVVNAGQSATEYAKLRTAIQAGNGPDVAQVEYQYLPSFEATNSLLNIAPYINALQFKSKYPAWVASQVTKGGGIYGIPQDTGPMGLLYRKDLLKKAGLTVPTTWAQFATDAVAYHKKFPHSYLADMPPTDIGEWIGLFWQAGSRPFGQNGTTLTLDLADKQDVMVANYWTKLIKEGAIAVDPDFTTTWYHGLSTGKYASWLTAAWGPLFLQGTAKNTAGKWAAAPLPQWKAGENVSGNWGGSTDAVIKSTQYPQQAALFASWLNQNATSALDLNTQQFLFPSTNVTLSNPKFKNLKASFYGGQQVNKVFGAISKGVATNFQWSPIIDYIYSDSNDVFGKAVTNHTSLAAALSAWNSQVVTYAKQQGYTVK